MDGHGEERMMTLYDVLALGVFMMSAAHIVRGDQTFGAIGSLCGTVIAMLGHYAHA